MDRKKTIGFFMVLVLAVMVANHFFNTSESSNAKNTSDKDITITLHNMRQTVKQAGLSEDLDELWKKFRNSSEKETVIKKIITYIALPETDENLPKIRAAIASLILNARKYKGVNELLEIQAEAADEKLRKPLEHILSFVEYLGDAAYTRLRKGANYYRQGDYRKALKLYDEALEIYPNYPDVYTNMANTYEAMRNMDKAFEYAKKAVELDPESPTASYNLARHYFLQRKFEAAVPYYKKALEFEPHKDLYNHGLARAYQQMGDKKNAVRYFKRYLKYAPHGEHEVLVKRYLASVGESVKVDETDIVNMLQRKKYARLEEHFNKLLKEGKKDSDGYSLLFKAYDRLVNPVGTEYIHDERLKHFKDWVKSEPSSHFAAASLGIFYIKFAWKARGAGFFPTVTEKGRQLFRERLELSRDYLERAYELNPTDAVVPAKLITVARGIGYDYDEMEKQFQRAIKADKTEFSAYDQKLLYLMPKWNGTKQEMFSFARESAANALPNSIISRVLAKAHWEMYSWSDDRKYFINNPGAYEETKNAYQKILNFFPDSIEAHNWLARTAYLAEDYDMAGKEFEAIGNNWLPNCWGNFKYFQKVKRYVKSVKEQRPQS
jgi:tetratricopeptide (TPR) repeat protein